MPAAVERTPSGCGWRPTTHCARSRIVGRKGAMASPKWVVALLSCALSACAAGSGRIGAGVDTLDLYAEAYGAGALGFSCYPALSVGGPGDPLYERLRHALRERRLRVRAVLVAEFGAERVEEIERASDEQEHGVFRTGCDLEETERARLRYRRLLRALEIRARLRR